MQTNPLCCELCLYTVGQDPQGTQANCPKKPGPQLLTVTVHAFGSDVRVMLSEGELAKPLQFRQSAPQPHAPNSFPTVL